MLIGKVEPGDVIGRCRILRELGRGGVGTVYLAKHQTLQIEVALKVLSPALSLDNPALAERFIREAQLAARIRHPNVIAVMDAAHDEPTGLYYIVFEYVGGGALAWHLRNGPLPEARRSPSCAASRRRSSSRRKTASSTATSSRRTSCSTRAARRSWPTWAWPSTTSIRARA